MQFKAGVNVNDNIKIEFKGLDELIKKLDSIPPKLKKALEADSKNIGAKMEKWAKENARWTDRTGNARQFLKSNTKWEDEDTLTTTMEHHVAYGIWLELCNEGKYAIIDEAINEFTQEFIKSWEELIMAVLEGKK